MTGRGDGQDDREGDGQEDRETVSVEAPHVAAFLRMIVLHSDWGSRDDSVKMMSRPLC